MLTGRTRYRVHQDWFKTLLVLQVQEEVTLHDSCGYSPAVTRWRDASVEDLTDKDERND